MITRRGVCYKLEVSPYVTEIDGVTYHFSSQLHLEKFKEKIQENRDTILYSLFKRFKIYYINNRLCDLVLYTRIESRGFYIEFEGEKFRCLKEVKLGGEPRIKRR